MPIKLLITLAFSLLICFLNYITSLYSNLGSVKTILIDSVIDLVFPIMSMISFYDPRLDNILCIIQLIIILITSLYFIFNKIQKHEEIEMRSGIVMITTLLSIFLTAACFWMTNSVIAENSVNISTVATNLHFRIDIISKLFVILTIITYKIKIKKLLKAKMIRLFDLLGILSVILTSLWNLWSISISLI